ncbi:DUF6668 family protein [Streptomyces naganishii]|uniref:Uncharacterized protein n=1 Tax=Streptomyces naganishii JCM 4654 TaxID=1306179 RepID=A0A918Y7Z3_9ACTN|nr:DUF6668 family protein [Streptomyces naganishii]GHD94064.1 hypothetical protein GCM10010508_53290 [Streptomyces naganishii JCM 4654]
MRTDVRQGPEIWIRGPVAAPAAGVLAGTGAVTDAERVPERPAGMHLARRRFSWLATHGGAGTTTLAAVYGGHDCGRDWPGPEAPRSVLLVARTHAAGLEAVVRALEVFRRGQAPAGLDLDAVVLVADAPGRLPRPLAQRVKPLESVIDVYRVPWVPAWRVGDLSGPPPRETAALARLTGAAGRQR